MNALKQLCGRCVLFVLVNLSLCFVLAAFLAESGASHGLRSKPSVELQASRTVITIPCPPDFHSISTCPSTAEVQVTLTALAKDFNKQSVIVYAVTGGRVLGEGSKVTWDFSDSSPGIYSATVEVQDNKKHRAFSSVTVKLQECSDCVDIWICPTIVVICYDQVKAGTPITCKLGSHVWFDPIYTYSWSARDSDDNDLSGSISRRGEYVSIPTKGLGGKAVITTVYVKELDPSCSRTAQGVTLVKP